MKYKFSNLKGMWFCLVPSTRYLTTPHVFIFTDHHFWLMLSNYKAGNCPLTEKGLYRYHDATYDVLGNRLTNKCPKGNSYSHGIIRRCAKRICH